MASGLVVFLTFAKIRPTWDFACVIWIMNSECNEEDNYDSAHQTDDNEGRETMTHEHETDGIMAAIHRTRRPDEGPYILTYSDGQESDILTAAEGQALLACDYVSEGFTSIEVVYGEDGEVETQAYEVYGEDETPEDYPDGNPHAPRLKEAPRGCVWTRDGLRRKN